MVMNFLCGDYKLDGDHDGNYSWLENFDVVITGR